MIHTARTALLVFFVATAALPAGDDMRAVNAIWTDFTSALRRGDYRQAYGMFTPESRAATPYPQFLREYGPASLARQLVLTPPASLSTQVDGDWAEIAFAGNGPTGPFRVGAALARNNRAWGLVMARNEAAEKLEAMARNLLAGAWQWRAAPDFAARLDGLARQAAAKTPLLARYRFEVVGGLARAVPTGPGLRAFHLDQWGVARPGAEPGRQTPPPEYVPPETLTPRQTPPPPPPARQPKLVNGLPELSEPPPPGAGPGPGDAIGMPPLPPPPLPPQNRYAPEPVHLPEFIG